MACVGPGVGGLWGYCGGSVFRFLCVPNLWYCIKISFVILNHNHGERRCSENPTFARHPEESKLRKGGAHGGEWICRNEGDAEKQGTL